MKWVSPGAEAGDLSRRRHPTNQPDERWRNGVLSVAVPTGARRALAAM